MNPWDHFPSEVAFEFSCAVDKTGMTKELSIAMRVLDNMFDMTPERVETLMAPVYKELI